MTSRTSCPHVNSLLTIRLPPSPSRLVYIIFSPLEKRLSRLSLCFHLLSLLSLVSPVEVDREEVLRGDAGPPRQRRVVLDARGRDERRGRVEEGRVRARAHQFAAIGTKLYV